MKNGNKNIETAEKLAKLILREMSGSEIDHSESIKELLKNNSDADTFLRNMSDQTYLKTACANYIDDSKEKKALELLDKMKHNQRRHRIARVLYIGSSVAAILLLSLFFFYATDKKRGFNTSTKQSTVLLAQNSPTLTFENGEVITLNADTKSNLGTEIMTQGNTITYKSPDSILQKITYHTISVPNQCIYHVVLSDGSQITLNANSKLKFPKQFIGDMREVFLEGEAHFKIAKSEAKFVVSSEHIAVKAYGTEFIVNLNRESIAETVLLNGVVGVTVKNGNKQEVMMRPNQLLTLEKRSGKVNLKDVDCDNYIGWTKGTFKISDDKLVRFIEKISSWYGVKYNFMQETDKNTMISVELDTKLTLNQINSILEVLTDKIIINEGNGVYMIK